MSSVSIGCNIFIYLSHVNVNALRGITLKISTTLVVIVETLHVLSQEYLKFFHINCLAVF